MNPSKERKKESVMKLVHLASCRLTASRIKRIWLFFKIFFLPFNLPMSTSETTFHHGKFSAEKCLG